MQERTLKRALMAAALILPLALAIPALAGEIVIEDAEFDAGQPIDNPLWPLIPGTTFVYEGESEDGLVHVEVYVTHDTRIVDGVECVVVFDREWIDGVLTERTYDWYAQDTEGNIWYFGEDTEELDEDGNVVSTEGSWEAGVDGAVEGIIMLAEPHAGDYYYQEYYEGEAEDQGKILRTNAEVNIDFGDFEDCVKIKEWTQLDHEALEHKYFAEGWGLVFIESRKGPVETEELVEILVDP